MKNVSTTQSIPTFSSIVLNNQTPISNKLRDLFQQIDYTLGIQPNIVWYNDYDGCGFVGYVGSDTSTCSTLEELVVELENIFKKRLLEKILDEERAIAKKQRILDAAKEKYMYLKSVAKILSMK